MLPDIRAVLAAVVAAVGLLMLSFGLVATFRVAQDSRAGSLQADLAQRGRSPVPDRSVPRAIVIVDMPAAPADTIVPAMVIEEAPASQTPESPAAELAAPKVEPPPEEPAQPVMAAMPAEAEAPSPSLAPSAIGGPSPQEVAQAEAEHRAAADRAKAKKAAAEKARKARIARERRARRAAQERAKQQAAGSFDSFNNFNNAQFNSFGASGGKPTAR